MASIQDLVDALTALQPAAAPAAAPPPKGPPKTLSRPFVPSRGADEARRWLRHVEVLAETGEWDSRATATWVCLQLEGEAASWLGSVPLATRQDWTALAAAFRARFCPTVPADVAYSRLRMRVREPGESPREFAAALDALAAELPRPPADAELLAQFMDGLDVSLRRTLRATTVRDMDAAVAFLTRLGEADTALPARVAAVSAGPTIDAQLEEIKAVLASLQLGGGGSGGHGGQGRRPQQRFQGRRPQQRREPRRCFACGSEKHLVADCPRQAQWTAALSGDGAAAHSGPWPAPAPAPGPATATVRHVQAAATEERPAWASELLAALSGARTPAPAPAVDSVGMEEREVRVVRQGSTSQMSWPLALRGVAGTTSALVDTGAEVTLVREGVLPDSLVRRTTRRPALAAADGGSLPTSGAALVTVEAGGHSLDVPVLVVPALAVDVLLGMDFLSAHVAQIDLVAGSVQLRRGGTVRLVKCGPRTPLRVAEGVLVPPRSAAWVECAGGGGHMEVTAEWAPHLPQVFVASAHGVFLTNPTSCVVPVPAGAVLATPLLGCAVVAPCEKVEEPDSPREPCVGEEEPEEYREQVRTILQRHRRLFEKKLEPGGNQGLPPLEVVTWGEPLRQRPRRLSVRETDVVNAEVEKMLRLGVIRPSVSPWASPVVLVRKKDGEIRFCVDFRALNRRTKKDTYPLPRADAILAAVGEAKIFSCLDLSKGYWQVPMAAASREKTAFSTPRGLFEFVVVPFGLTNAPSAFQRMMDQVLGDLVGRCCHVFLDDVIVYSRTPEEHLEHLAAVLERLAAHDLILNAKKSVFATRVSPFLGHMVSSDGLRVDASKVAAMAAMPPPHDVSGVRRFLGMANYYAQFVPRYADVATPLFRLTKKGVPWRWGREEAGAHASICELLTSAPVLAHPRPREPFILSTDASAVGLGAVLEQEVDGKRRPVAFASRTLNKAEQNYTTTERECLALVWAVRHFRHLLDGAHVTVYTDHAALTYLLRSAPSTGRLQRWVATLQEFSLDIYHKPGVALVVPDALSRAPLPARGPAEVEPRGMDWRVPFAVPPAPPLPPPTGPRLAAHLRVPQAGEGAGPIKLGWARRPRTAQGGTSRGPGPQTGGEPGSSKPEAREVESGEGGDDEDDTGEEEDAVPESLLQDVDWAEEQVKDPWVAQVGAWVDDRTKPMPPGLPARMAAAAGREAGVVVIRWKEHARVLVPHQWQQRLLRYAHDGAGGGHHGVQRAAARIVDGYFWPGWWKQLATHVAQCDACQRQSGPPGRVVGRRGALDETSRWATVALDMAGPLPRTSSGNRYFLLAVDHFSKFVVARAVPNATAYEAVKFWNEEVVAKHGAPLRLLTDNGSNFVALEFVAAVEACGTAKVTTTPYNPQGDGTAERHIGTLKGRLRRAMEATDAEWDSVLPWAVMAMNSTPSTATGLEPYLVMHGHMGRLKLGGGDKWAGPRPGESALRAAVREAASRVKRACQTILGRRRVARSRERATLPSVTKGEPVLVWEPTQGPKGAWAGPFCVAKVPKHGVVEVEDMEGGNSRRVNRRHVKRYLWSVDSGLSSAPPSKDVGAGEDVLE